jgi:hypothetical protein
VAIEGRESGPYILGFGQGSDGEVYLMGSDALGPVGQADRVYRLRPAS